MIRMLIVGYCYGLRSERVIRHLALMSPASFTVDSCELTKLGPLIDLETIRGTGSRSSRQLAAGATSFDCAGGAACALPVSDLGARCGVAHHDTRPKPDSVPYFDASVAIGKSGGTPRRRILWGLN